MKSYISKSSILENRVLASTIQSEGDAKARSLEALFIHAEGHLTEYGGGGVQICTREYFRTLEASGFKLIPITLVFDGTWRRRVENRLFPNPYRRFNFKKISRSLKEKWPDMKFIFLNLRNLSGLAQELREWVNDSCQIIMLSHGLESVDYVQRFYQSHRNSDRVRSFCEKFVLGDLISEETRSTRYFDHVFCLTPFDVEIERWLGAKKATWLPRTIPDRRLNWNPCNSRVGFVGRLDYWPTKESLCSFLEAFVKRAPSHARFRLVGGPPKKGLKIARQFPAVDYLGQLSDQELGKEACTWNCFVQPLFFPVRGCNTKLAVALGWEIPVVTTPIGCRGYVWSEGKLPLAETPESLAELALEMLGPRNAYSAQQEISKMKKSAPTLEQTVSRIQTSLSLPSEKYATA